MANLPPSSYTSSSTSSSSSRVPLDPRPLHHLLHAPVVLPPVGAVQPRGLGVGRRVRVGIAQQRLHRRQHGRDVVDRRPRLLQDVKADAAVGVDVGVVHLGDELDQRRAVGVLLGELERELEGSYSFREEVVFLVSG